MELLYPPPLPPPPPPSPISLTDSAPLHYSWYMTEHPPQGHQSHQGPLGDVTKPILCPRDVTSIGISVKQQLLAKGSFSAYGVVWLSATITRRNYTHLSPGLCNIRTSFWNIQLFTNRFYSEGKRITQHCSKHITKSQGDLFARWKSSAVEKQPFCYVFNGKYYTATNLTSVKSVHIFCKRTHLL